MSVRYEWDVEMVDKHDDIIDHLFQGSYAGAVKELSEEHSEDLSPRIVLVRDDDKGRSWAYLVDGKLPEYFEDAMGVETAKVPVRFVREVGP